MRVSSLYRPAASLRVTGEDAFTFLQGQFTNELRQGVGAATYGLWLNQKGKMIADSQVLRLAEREFLLISHGSPAAVIQQRLEDYIVADDVALSDETSSMHGVTLWGAGVARLATDLLGANPVGGRFDRSGEVLVLMGRRLPGESVELIGPAHRINELQAQALARGAVAVGRDETEYARISAGFPDIPGEVGPGDLPGEAGLEDTAISYTKGCYLGQEVMARLKNLGQVRRQLRSVHGSGPAPAPLAALFQGEKKVGEIRAAARRGNEFVAAAMLSLVNLDPAAGLSFTPGGAAAITLGRHG